MVPGTRRAGRLNADQPSLTPIDVKTTAGNRASYRLLSLPLYLVEELHRLLDGLPDIGAATPRRRPRG